jgi:YVTN family beta-propeller protein
VTRSEANTVDAFDPVKMTTVKRIPVADDPDAIIYDGFDRLMYVSNGDSHVASLIDTSTLTAVGTIQLGGHPEYAVLDPTTRLLYQSLRDINVIIAVDIAKRAVVQRWPLLGCEAPSGLALDQESHRLFIGCSANSVLAVFDLDEHQVVTTLPIGKGPDSVAFDPQLKRIYCTGRAGVLVGVQQIGANEYTVLDSVHLHYGAHTLALDSSTHAVYVACAGLIVSPQVAVFMPR